MPERWCQTTGAIQEISSKGLFQEKVLLVPDSNNGCGIFMVDLFS